MISITRRLEFDYGHRVLGHEGKCAHLHGHRGVVEITVAPIVSNNDAASGLDPIGRVIDFGVLKSIVGRWIDDNWDHNMILNPGDPLLLASTHAYISLQHKGATVRLDSILGGKIPYILPEGTNPTAENLALVLHQKVDELLKEHFLKCVNVRFHETPNCFADSNAQFLFDLKFS